MKKILKILGVLFGVFILGIIALLILVPSPEESVDDNQNTDLQEEQAEDFINRKFKVGEVVNYRGLEMTVTKAEFTEPNQYIAPDRGKVLTIHVDTKNNTDKRHYVEDIQFKVYDESGTATSYYHAYDENSLEAYMDAGKRGEGKIFFDVPVSDKYELIWTPTTFDNPDSITIEIEIEM
ncbi:DUF4352 domain-containing protein [Bacillus ndiopicus]|uniref:DUF4352 domain-containing protein n=1 Tax=Bacillus ndiopicus TaxID=1347368 RepID=UPI0006934B0D|nr:DUF4352 domain-containing protein [Bacillus ndiopicus]